MEQLSKPATKAIFYKQSHDEAAITISMFNLKQCTAKLQNLVLSRSDLYQNNYAEVYTTHYTENTANKTKCTSNSS